MTAVFADTFYFIALSNPADRAHDRAVSFVKTSRIKMVTTPWVLSEIADGFCGRQSRAGAVRMINLFRADLRATVVAASDDLFGRGWALYSQRRDKDWSLTDCISFVTMRDHGLTDALTGDHHFGQAGFRALLG